MGGLKAKKNAKDPFTEMAKAFGLGRRDRHRPAQRVRRADRRPGLEAGLLEGDQGLLLRQGEDRLPGGRQQGPAAGGVPAAAVEGELRRRLRLPRRRRGQLRDRPGRHDDHPAADGAGLRRGRQRRHAGDAAHRPGGGDARTASWCAGSSRSRPAGCRSSQATLSWLRQRAARRDRGGTGSAPFAGPRSRWPRSRWRPRPAPVRSTASRRRRGSRPTRRRTSRSTPW